MQTWQLVLLLGACASLADLGGGLALVALRVARPSASMLNRIVALAAGFLLGATFLDRLPEALSAGRAAAFWVMAGYFVLWVAEGLLAGHHHSHGEGEHQLSQDVLTGGHELAELTEGGAKHLVGATAGAGALVGMLVHAFFDGVAVAAGFSSSVAVGWLIFLAVLLHKLPEGFGISAIILAAGAGRRSSFLAAAALGMATFLGTLVTLIAGAAMPSFGPAALAMATGAFVYVAASDLVPLLNQSDRRMVLLVLLGVMAFYLPYLLIIRTGLE